jgi:hypothetical protein
MKALIALSLAALTLGSSPARAAELPPGQIFHGPLLDVHSPESPGWTMVHSAPDGIAFARRGTHAGESDIAQVEFLSLSPTADRDAFVALIKAGLEREAPPGRFRSIKAEYTYSEERGYPCVLYSAQSEDTKARVSMFKHETQQLQMRALYCRHPKRPEGGFAVVYSHRGATTDEGLDAKGDAFISGVQVPSP